MAARDARNKAEEQYFLGGALVKFPNAVEVASAQFELAWDAHEAKDFDRSSQLLTEHLARYADRDTTTAVVRRFHVAAGPDDRRSAL